MARQLRSADTLLGSAVHKAISALQLQPEDIAAVKLAHQYAATIDDAPADEREQALANFGPKLLAALDALRATPKARAAGKGGQPSRAESRLAALRAARPA